MLVWHAYAINTVPLLASTASNTTPIRHQEKDVQMIKFLVAVLSLPKTLLTLLADSIRNSAGVEGRDVLPIDVLGDDKSDK